MIDNYKPVGCIGDHYHRDNRHVGLQQGYWSCCERLVAVVAVDFVVVVGSGDVVVMMVVVGVVMPAKLMRYRGF